MLVSGGSAINFSLPKWPNANVPLFGNNHLGLSLRGATAVPFKGNIRSPLHAVAANANLQQPQQNTNSGIGILEFFQGKNILLTGATGFLGKVVVEKILRSTPVGKLYILIQAKDKEAAFYRFTNEIINSDLFKCLKEEYGKDYEGFVMEKLIPIIGNVCEPNLGMEPILAGAVRNDVHVIIHSAANTTLNDRYDLLLDANMNAPLRLMRFAKTCKNLELFAHISTAYVNGRREGIIHEEPLMMGETGRKEEGDHLLSSSLDVADEISMIQKSCTTTASTDINARLRKLGNQRAEFFGWNNAYHMTKAMAEMTLNEIRGEVPLLILRPTIIESCYKHPLPGWIQGNRVFDPMIISYGKGMLPACLADPEVILDLIPVDMVANTIIAAIAKHGPTHEPQLNVYHVASSVTNPLRVFDAFEYLYEYFNAAPLAKSQNIARIKFFNDFKDFSKFTRQEIFRHNWPKHTDNIGQDENMIRKIQNQCNAKVAYTENLCKFYQFAGFFNARFHNGNTQKLIEEMSKDEQTNFEVDARNIDWNKYLQEIHIPGLKKYIINNIRKIST